MLGYSYALGQHGLTTNITKSISWLTKAADSGNVEVQSMLGEWYRNPPTPELKQNIPLAIKYLTMAANQYDADAQSKLSWHYKHGEGVPQDPIMYLWWLRQAALTGSDPVMSMQLASHFSSGEVLAEDVVMAYGWAIVADSNGMSELKNLLDGSLSIDIRNEGFEFGLKFMEEGIQIKKKALEAKKNRHSPHLDFYVRDLLN